MAAGVLYNRMQNLHISGNCDNNKFYHYCYVCNTQLNSCKQALLHCSGKRHRKKLQFLQNRKGGHFGGPVTQLAPDAFQTPANGAPPPPPAAHIGSLAPQALVGANAPAGATGPTLVAAIPGAPAPPPGHLQAVPNAAAASHGCYYPIMTPMEHWVTPAATAPPAFVHFHGQFGAVHTSHLFRQQNAPAHLPAGQHLAPRPLRPGFVTNGPHMPPRPLLRYHEGFASTGSNSPIMLTDMSAFGSGSSTGTRSAVISPSETSSISSESLISPKTRLLYRCYVCQRQFVTNMQLQVHLQTSRHYKQYLMQAGSHLERTGDSSETDSWVSSPSIYYCMVCNIAVNSPAQLEAHTASHKQKLRLPVPGTNGAPRTHSRSSSTSSETPVELIMDSGYVSGSGDELICISHPTPDKPTAKFRCQICNIFLNSPAQAKQHLNSQKHTQRFSNLRPQFRRKSSSSFKRKQSTGDQQVQKQASETSSLTEVIAEGEDCASLSAATRSLDTPSPDQEHDLEEESLDDNEDDKATMVRCHSL